MKNLVIGLIAHVDAGKTTLSEALLAKANPNRAPGRVDDRSTVLDYDVQERARGITIFAKTAVLELPAYDLRLTLLDTPGHVAFSGETERTLAALDCAVLVISGSDGVQAHTETLWKLIRQQQIPTVAFITKTDLTSYDREAVFDSLSALGGASFVDFTENTDDLPERLATASEKLFDAYTENGGLTSAEIMDAVTGGDVVPVVCGSGLRQTGIDRLLEVLSETVAETPPDDGFSARVIKILHDDSGARVTLMRLYGGELSPRSVLTYTGRDGSEITEKITAVAERSGEKAVSLKAASAGTVVAVTGLSGTYAGQALGGEQGTHDTVLLPVMRYTLDFGGSADDRLMLPKLRELEEEDPLLSVLWDARHEKITISVMGSVQREVLERLIADRFGVAVTLTDGRVLYRESIGAPVVGVGHYEPLRHYAEVHLLLTPLPRGSGIRYASAVSLNDLDGNWQNLILSQLAELQPVGVLTGAALTDLKITLIAGRAHLKHTEGGDFREAACRALRQGLMTLKESGQCLLLEPWSEFTLTAPIASAGRIMTELAQIGGECAEQSRGGTDLTLAGRAPAAALGEYAEMIPASTHGRGRLTIGGSAYDVCARQEEAVAKCAYRAEGDLDWPADSVFCSHGAGVMVPWREVPQAAHLPVMRLPEPEKAPDRQPSADRKKDATLDVDAILGPIRRRVYSDRKVIVPAAGKTDPPSRRPLTIIDGYNVIHAWEEFSALAADNLESARDALLDLLTNCTAFTGKELTVVFDAYNVKGSRGHDETRGHLRVVYTREDETADARIERMLAEIGTDYAVRVVTGDGLIQLHALRTGILRVTPREFREETRLTEEAIRRTVKERLEKLHRDADRKIRENIEKEKERKQTT